MSALGLTPGRDVLREAGLWVQMLGVPFQLLPSLWEAGSLDLGCKPMGRAGAQETGRKDPSHGRSLWADGTCL